MSSTKWNTCFSIIVYFLFSLNLRVSQSDTFEEFLSLTLPDLCPYSTFCTVGPSKPFKHKQKSPCCKPCSCHHDCLMFGNCCPDFVTVHNNTMSISKAAECSSPIHYGFDGFVEDAVLKRRGLDWYHIISTCPLEYREPEVINKCINPDRENVKDIAIVSDNRGRAFSNRFCAQCHGVRIFIWWDLKLSCVSYPSGFTNVPITLEEMNENACLIISSPPTADLALAARCIRIDNDKCNTNEAVNPNIERACQSIRIPFAISRFTGMTMYKNPYCYLCDKNADSEIITICPLDKDGGEKDTGGYSFNAILDVTSKEHTETKIVNTNGCLPTEIFDYHFGKCRTLNCPVTTVPIDGKCAQMFKTTASLALFVGIGISYANEDTRNVFNRAINDREFLRSLLETITFDIFLDIGIHKLSCGKCLSEVMANMDKSGFIINYGLQTNSECQVSSIINSLKKFKSKRKYSSFDKKTLQSAFSAQLSYDIQIEFDYFYNQYEVYGNMYRDESECPARILLKSLFYCEYVDIQATEYSKLLMANNSGIDIGHFVAGVARDSSGNIVDTVYSICVDKYMNAKNAGRTFGAYLMLEYIAMAVIVQLAVSG